MDLESISVFMLGMLARLGIPVGFTILVIVLLARLDSQWQEEAKTEAGNMRLRAEIRNSGCWEVRNCSPEKKAKCPAFANPETPCWQLFRDKNGVLREGCIGCSVFRGAPVPVRS